LWDDVDELAGVVGVDPGPLTLRRLLNMNTGRRRHDWQQTARILMKLHNVNCKDESELIHDPAVFMPPGLAGPTQQRPKAPPPTAEDCALLRKLFPGGKKK